MLEGRDAAQPDRILIGPGIKPVSCGVAIDPRRIHRTVLDARAVGILTWLLLHRHLDENIWWHASGIYVRLEAQGTLFSMAADAATALVERLQVLGEWVARWSRSVVAQQEPPHVPPALEDIGREHLEAAIFDISWTRQRHLLIGSKPEKHFVLVIPPRSQLVRCSGTANLNDDDEGALVHSFRQLTGLGNSTGTVCYVPSENVAPGIGPGTKANLIRTHGPTTRGWRNAASLVRLTPGS